MEWVYDADENVYIFIPKIKTKENTKAKTETETKNKLKLKLKRKLKNDPDEDDYFFKPKDNTKTEAEPKVVVPCWVCGEKFKSDIALQTHMNKHWRGNLTSTIDYDIEPSINQRQLYIT